LKELLQAGEDLFPATAGVLDRGRAAAGMDHGQPASVANRGDLELDPRRRFRGRSGLVDDVEGVDQAARRVDLQDLALEVHVAIGRFARPARADLPVRDAQSAIPVLARLVRIGEGLPEALWR